MGRLDYALRELDRVQRTDGPTLREMGRSCATGTVDERRVLSELYSAAPAMGQRLGEARRVLEWAIAGIRRASDSGRPHEVEQAKVLADAALRINILTLETDAKVPVQAKEALRGGTNVTITPDHLPPMHAPTPLVDTADLGPSVLGR